MTPFSVKALSFYHSLSHRLQGLNLVAPKPTVGPLNSISHLHTTPAVLSYLLVCWGNGRLAIASRPMKAGPGPDIVTVAEGNY